MQPPTSRVRRPSEGTRPLFHDACPCGSDRMLGMGGTRFVVASAFLAAVVSGCDAAPETTEASKGPTVAPSTSDASSTPDRPRRTRPPADAEGGARFDVPDAVILEQLRRAAERIAQNYTAPPTPTPTPADIDPGTNRAL